MTERRSGWQKSLRRSVSVLLAAGLLLVLSGFSLVRLVGWESLPEPPPQARVRLFAGDREIASFRGLSPESQIWLPLRDIPPQVVQAVLTAEDRRFYRHHGLDFLAMVRAVRANLVHGRVAQGASTITQQLARTLFLNGDRTWERKLREGVIAVALELRYDKGRILEAYLNSVYMGHDAGVPVHGMAAAARHFLHKDLAAVRLDEAAMLAAAINAPNGMLADRERARVRRNTILQAMQAAGWAPPAVVKAAVAQPSRWQPTPQPAPYFVDAVREELSRRVALPADGELRIATSLDLDLQRAAEAAIERGLQRIERRRGIPVGKLQGALVAIEPATGQIRALVGGRRYAESAFNRATRARRQPGSLFKPFVYLAAFESARGVPLTPASVVADEPLQIPTESGVWSPRDPSGSFKGPVTIRRALEESLNVPAVRVAQQVGPDRVVEVARALGLTGPLAPVPSLALGTSEVSLLEITSAFGALANQGMRAAPTTLAALPSDGAPDAHGAAPEPVRVVSAESAFLVTNLLRGVMHAGTGRASAQWGLSEITAGKTGTTDDFRDAWFIGYTPDLAIGVWVGADDGTSVGLTGSQAALPIWASVMRSVVKRVPPRDFTPPPGVVFASVNRETGRLASVWCGDGGPVIQEAFKAGTEPNSACARAESTVGQFLGWIRGLFRRTP